jgi:hypothetical protein
MARGTEEVQRDIEQTREELETTLEAIGDKVAPKKAVRRAKWKAQDKVEDVKERVSPARLARRGTDNVLHRLHDVRLSVMGSDDEGDDEVTQSNGSTRTRIGNRTRALEEGASDARQRASDATGRAGEAASTVVEKAKMAPETVARSAKGNPLVAGLLVFGGGYLVASRLRPTDRERTLAERAKERLEPVKQQALEAGRSMADEIKSVAEGGIGTATVRAVRSEVRQRAADAAETVKEKATEVKDKATSSDDAGATGAAGAGKGVKRTSRAASTKAKAEPKGAARTTGKTTRRRTGATGPAGTAATSRRRSTAKAG